MRAWRRSPDALLSLDTEGSDILPRAEWAYADYRVGEDVANLAGSAIYCGVASCGLLGEASWVNDGLVGWPPVTALVIQAEMTSDTIPTLRVGANDPAL